MQQQFLNQTLNIVYSKISNMFGKASMDTNIIKQENRDASNKCQFYTLTYFSEILKHWNHDP